MACRRRRAIGDKGGLLYREGFERGPPTSLAETLAVSQSRFARFKLNRLERSCPQRVNEKSL
jgi:hypothetical protein